MGDQPAVDDASDAVELAEEIVARFRLMQTHEETDWVSVDAYHDNRAELRALLEACTLYVAAPRIGVNAF